MAGNKDKVGVTRQSCQVVMKLLDLTLSTCHPARTHKSAATALFVGTRGAVIDVEMSEIWLLTA